MTDVIALRWIFEELVRAGVSDVVVCPGSRSTPLALAARAHPGLRVRVLLDERSAGFFALGLAKASRQVVAVIVTSGTAAANLFPAVVEASMARVPLLLLTADRPPELQDRGAPQTIDQVRLFGSYVRWFAQLPLLDGAPETRRHVRSVVGRAVVTAAASPAGPVHLDAPFREPLVPVAALGPLGDDTVVAADADPSPSRPFTGVVAGRSALTVADVTAIAARLGSVERGLIVAGPQDDPALPAALARLAAATGYPIIADPLSGLRCGRHDRSKVLAHADHLVRPGSWREEHLPDLVIRFGATPTSKPIATLISETAPVQIVVDLGGGWSDPAIIPTTFIHADPTATAVALADEIEDARARALAGTADPPEHTWSTAWTNADRRAERALQDWLAGVEARGESFEGLPFAVLGASLPDDAILWAGNSMPVRDLDAWLASGPRAIRPLSNRGANGIDGVVSTALGAAAADVGPVTLVVGDVSFLHDLNALVAARLHGLTATIVIIENDGGGIFSFLPQATTNAPEVGLPDHYESLFGTPHGIDLGLVVAALGGEYRSVGAAELRDVLAKPATGPGVRVLGFATDRRRNVVLHQEAALAVAEALQDR